MKIPIYMDYHSTTPVHPRVLEAMLPLLHGGIRQRRLQEPRLRVEGGGGGGEGASAGGGPDRGLPQGDRLDERRHRVRQPGPEGRDPLLPVQGAPPRHHLRIEHKAVLDSCHALEREGWEVTFLDVGRDGVLDPEAVRRAIRPDTRLVVVNHGSNVIGTVQPVAEIGAICREAGVTFCIDAAQTAGVIPIDMQAMKIDVVAFTGASPPCTEGSIPTCSSLGPGSTLFLLRRSVGICTSGGSKPLCSTSL